MRAYLLSIFAGFFLIFFGFTFFTTSCGGEESSDVGTKTDLGGVSDTGGGTDVETTTDAGEDAATDVQTGSDVQTDAGTGGQCGEGELVFTLTSPGDISNLLIDGQNNIYTIWSNGIDTEMWKIGPDGKQTVFMDKAKMKEIGSINGLYWDAKNNKIFATINDDSIIEIEDNNSYKVIYTGGKALGFTYAWALTRDSSGDFFVGNGMGTAQKIFKISSDGKNGSIFLVPQNPTGIGNIAFNSKGDLIYSADNLYKVPSGASKEEVLYPDLENWIKSAYEGKYGQIPSDAMMVKNKYSSSLSIDNSDNIYFIGHTEYTTGTYPDMKTTRLDMLMKVNGSGSATIIEGLNNEYLAHVDSFGYQNGYIYTTRTCTKTPGKWEFYKIIMKTKVQ